MVEFQQALQIVCIWVAILLFFFFLSALASGTMETHKCDRSRDKKVSLIKYNISLEKHVFSIG